MRDLDKQIEVKLPAIRGVAASASVSSLIIASRNCQPQTKRKRAENQTWFVVSAGGRVQSGRSRVWYFGKQTDARRRVWIVVGADQLTAIGVRTQRLCNDDDGDEYCDIVRLGAYQCNQNSISTNDQLLM